uniref:Uncharacterized protein n=1 Tax=Lepeophtheirus salmonis TaxID=72036 RepID=A0A0K2T6W5_LEPSM
MDTFMNNINLNTSANRLEAPAHVGHAHGLPHFHDGSSERIQIGMKGVADIFLKDVLNCKVQ